MADDTTPPDDGGRSTTRMVGYGSTPEHSRWQKGQSGNPRGRPKGAKGFLAELNAEFSEPITITEGGKPRIITKRRALIKSLVANALKGDVQALKLGLQWAATEADAAQAGQPGALPPLDPNDVKILQSYLKRHPLPQGGQ